MSQNKIRNQIAEALRRGEAEIKERAEEGSGLRVKLFRDPHNPVLFHGWCRVPVEEFPPQSSRFQGMRPWDASFAEPIYEAEMIHGCNIAWKAADRQDENATAFGLSPCPALADGWLGVHRTSPRGVVIIHARPRAVEAATGIGNYDDLTAGIRIEWPFGAAWGDGGCGELTTFDCYADSDGASVFTLDVREDEESLKKMMKHLGYAPIEK